MKVRYTGPSDSVDVGSQVFVRNHQVEVDDELAGWPEDPKRTALVAELADAVAASDHERSRDLRQEIVDLGPKAMGSGLLAGPFVEVKPKASKEGDE